MANVCNDEKDQRLKSYQIKNIGQANCGNKNCNFVGVKFSDMDNHTKSCNGVPDFNLFCCIHCRKEFSTKKDHLKHQQNCSVAVKLGSNSKKVENLHFRVIKQMKNKDSSEDHIIQPGPDLPKGQYRRRRAYRAEHKNSWALTLEKFKYVKCIYQNCYFIAMSLEDMIAHFGYCNGDGSFAKFVCPYCNGRVTSEAILLKHIKRSHPLKDNSIKMEPIVDKISDKFHDSDLKIQNAEEANFSVVQEAIFNETEKTHEISTGEPSTSRKAWQDQISEFGHAFCRKSLCNFISPNIPDLEVHLRTCDGTPDFETLNCPKCRYRLQKREDFVNHVLFCKDERVKYFSTFGCEVIDSPLEGLEEDDFEIGPVLRQYQSKHQAYSKCSKRNSISPPKSLQEEDNSTECATAQENTNKNGNSKTLNVKGNSKQKTRGRPKKASDETEKNQENKVKCGKCDFQGSKSGFVNHNLKIHVGLGWIEGEKPVDLNDEKLIIRLVKEAFRLTKKAACENCDDVKRSVMGFVSHIQNCGKSEEEKMALKVECPHCEGRYLKYSLSSHIKICCPSSEEKEEKSDVLEEVLDPSGRRRSAIRAASKFQQVLNENDEAESNQDSHYIFYERGSERIPKLNSKLSNLWYKLKRENKKIPCRHTSCNIMSDDVREAKNHHYNCPSLPEKVFMCELCDFYSVDEPSVQSHVTTHRKYVKQKKTYEEEVKIDEEMKENDEDDNDDEEEVRSSEEEGDNLDESRKRKRKEGDDRTRKKPKFSSDPVKPDLDIEFRLKQSFCRRERIDNVRGIQFYSNGLEMTLQEELATLENSKTWPELHTTPQDWSPISPHQASRFFPELTKSVFFRLSGNDAKWRRFERFESDLTEGGPVMFTGGSVRSMSWCKISSKRMLEKTHRQYLAVTTARKLDHLKDIYERSSLEKSSLLQIWDCGVLDNNAAENTPKFSLGIVQKGGEIWDLAWFCNDTYAEGAENRLRRLGLLATASEDGAVRVWSVCDPEQLENSKGLPIYTTEPVVILTADKDEEESCLQLSIGSDGVIAGGFGNGTVAIWNLKNVSSPFCKKVGKSKIIRAHLVFQAHKTAITALTFCPSNSRYLSTAGLNRFVKIWDLEFPSVPVEQYNKEYSLDNIWTLNWPSLIYNFDDVVINFNKGAVKFIKDILTDRHQSTFSMEDSCLSLSFSDWLNALCGGSVTGEIKLRLLKNLIHDQKRHQSTISSVRLEKLTEGGSKETSVREPVNEVNKNKNFLRTYDEVDSGFGLVFKDNLGIDKGKPKKPQSHPEEFPIRAINKTISSVRLEKLTEGGSKETSVRELVNEVNKNKNFLRTCDEVDSGFGLVFKDNLGIDKGKPKKPQSHPEEFYIYWPSGHAKEIRSTDRPIKLSVAPESLRYSKKEVAVCELDIKGSGIAFNPNFISFTHIAVGYNCGLIRILPLKELQSTKSLKFFIEKTLSEKF